MHVARQNDLSRRIAYYTEHYGLGDNKQPMGLEAYAVHLFAQEDGLDSVLEGLPSADADLSPYILHGDDLGVDGVLTDPAGKRVVLIQCTTQALDKLEGKLTTFASVVDRLLNPKIFKTGGEQIQDLLSSLGDQIDDGYSIELRFVTNRPIGGKEKLYAIVEAANNGYDEVGKRINLELYGSADLLQLETDLTAATTAAPIGNVAFSIQRNKILDWDIDSGAPRDTLVGLIKGNELANLYAQYRNKLFAANIRLPLITKKVNPDIRATAEDHPDDFFYYNNGVSAVCKSFELSDTQVHAVGFQIINGAQTVDALRKALRVKKDDRIYVLFRLTASESYGRDKHFTESVIRFNNTQNPVKVYDFFSNDRIQLWLSKHLDELSGKAPMPAFYYVHKSGHRPSNVKGRRQLKIDAFAGIRHAFIYGPIASYREPASFFDRDSLYPQAFGVNGKIEDAWDHETLAQAACAIAINAKVQQIAREVQAKERILRKNAPEKQIPEARYLFRLSRYVTALVGVGLRAIIPAELTDYSVLKASQASFDRFVDPLVSRARDLVEDEMVERSAKGAEQRTEYNFARDEKAWGRLSTRIESAALTKIDFSGKS